MTSRRERVGFWLLMAATAIWLGWNGNAGQLIQSVADVAVRITP